MTDQRTADAPGALNWATLITLSVIWGTAFMSVRIALDGIGPMWVAAGRTLIAAACLIVASQFVGQGLGRIPSRKAWIYAVAFGVFAASLPFTLLAWGQQHVPSAFAGVSMGTVPLLTLLLAAIFTSETGIGPRRIIGITLGFFGLIALVGPGAFGGDSVLVQWGRVACALSAASYAISNIVGRLAPPMPPIALATAAMTTAGFTMLPIALLTEGLPSVSNSGSGLALLWVALGPTALAAFLQLRVLQSAGPLFLSLVSYMVPMWSVIFGIFLLSEQLSVGTFVALGLILSGIAVAQSRQIAKAFRRR